MNNIETNVEMMVFSRYQMFHSFRIDLSTMKSHVHEPFELMHVHISFRSTFDLPVFSMKNGDETQ
jgi:hypothetical protein